MQYGYDLNGNRLIARLDGLENRYTYTPASDRLLDIEGRDIRYHYNNVGEPEQIERGGQRRTLSYGPDGQIARIEQDGRPLAQYVYNHARQRIAKTTGQGGQQTTTYFTWQDGLLDAEIDEQGQVQRRYLYLGVKPVALIDYGAADKTVRLYAIHVDHLGTPQALTDERQAVVWQARYDSFGRAEIQVSPASSGQAARPGLIRAAHADAPRRFEFNLRFPGQYEDAETGYHYNWHRYYDPETGRYLTPDPIGLAGGDNAYAYVGGDPLSYIDPSGLDREIIFWSPLARPGSIFGHVSARGGNGENYSFGPGGWDTIFPTADQYIDRQTNFWKRTGLGLVVELNEAQDAEYDQCMLYLKTTTTGDDYNGLTNCTSPSQMCLIKVGVPISPSIFPVSYRQELLDSGSVKFINWYRPTK